MMQEKMDARDEIDVRKITLRFLRAWPLFLISLLVFGLLAIVIKVSYPPVYTAKVTMLVEKPRSSNDPSTLVTSLNHMVKTDDYFYNNQKVAFKSYPLVKKTIQNLSLQIRYLKKDLIDYDLYKRSPIFVEVDSSYLSLEKFKVPYNIPFYITYKDLQSFEIEASGEYPVTNNDFQLKGKYNFGEWIQADQIRFKVVPLDTAYIKVLLPTIDVFNTTFGFEIKNLNDLALDYINNIKIQPEGVETTVFGVSLSGNPPQKQQDFLSELSNVVIKNHLQVKSLALDNALSFLNSELQEIENELFTSESALGDFKTTNQITNLGSEATLLMEEAQRYENEKITYLVRESYYKYLLEFLENNSNFSSLLSPQAFGIDDRLLTDLTGELVTLQHEKNMLKAAGTEENPLYKQIEARIESNKSLIITTVSGFLASNNIMLKSLNKRINELDQQTYKIPQTERELLRLERRYRLNEAFYTNLMEKKAEAEITKVSIFPDISIIEPAYITTKNPSFPNVIFLGSLAVIVGLIIPAGFVILKSIFSYKIYNTGDIKKFLPSVPVLGKLSRTNINSLSDIAAFPDSKTGNEAGSHYLLLKKIVNKGVISVSSVNSSDPSSWLTMILAEAFARNGHKTLMVDVNFIHPSLHEFAEINNQEGIKEVLEGKISPGQAIKNSIVPGLDVLTTGMSTVFIHPNSVINLLEGLKTEYQYIFINTSPFGIVAQTADIMNYSDASILNVIKGSTSFGDLETAEDSLSLVRDAKVFSILSNAIPDEIFYYSFGNKRDYYRNKPETIKGRIFQLFQGI